MSFLTSLLDPMEPVLLEAGSVFLGAVLLYLANLFRQFTGVQIEARHREALHSALMTGVQAALREGPQPAKRILIEQAVEYARKSVPQAIKRLGPDNFILRRLAERYANDALERIGAKVLPDTPRGSN